MKLTSSSKIQILWFRIVTAWRLVFKYKHYAIVSVDEKNLEKLIINTHHDGKHSVAFYMGYSGLQEYYAYLVLKNAVDSYDHADVILAKGDLEAAVIEKMKQKEKSNK